MSNCKFFEVDMKTVNFFSEFIQINDEWQFYSDIKRLDNISVIVLCECDELVEKCGCLNRLIEMFYKIYLFGLCNEVDVKNIDISDFNSVVLKSKNTYDNIRVGVAFNEEDKIGYIVYNVYSGED